MRPGKNDDHDQDYKNDSANLIRHLFHQNGSTPIRRSFAGCSSSTEGTGSKPPCVNGRQRNEALYRQNRAASGPVDLDGFTGIVRTRRMVLAGPAEERRQKQFCRTAEIPEVPRLRRNDRASLARFLGQAVARGIKPSSSRLMAEKFAVRGRTARVNHNVPSWRNLLSVQPYDFA